MFNILNLMAVLTLNSSDYDKGLSDAKSNADSFSDKLKNGIGNAAKIATKTIGAVTAAGTALSAILVKTASDTAAYGDNIDKMSQKMGLSAEAYQEWDAIMQHSGTSMESLKASMKTMANAVEKNNSAFARLGITEQQLHDLNTEDLFTLTISSLQNVEDQSERTYLAGQLLGRGATELGALLNSSAEETEAMRKRVHELGGVMSDEAVKASAKYQDNMQDLRTAISGVKRSLVSDLLPGMNSVIAGFTSLVIGEEGASKSIREGFQNMLASITEKLPKVMAIASELLTSFTSAIIENLPAIAETGTQLIVSLVNGLITALPQLATAAVQIVSSVGTTIIENIPIILESLGEVFTQLYGYVSEQLPTIIENGFTMLSNFVDGMLSGLPDATEKFGSILTSIFNLIMDNFPTILTLGYELIAKLAVGIANNLPAIITTIGEVISGALNRIMQDMPTFWQKGWDIIMKMIEGITNNLPAIVSAISTVLANLLSTIVSNLPQMLSKGMEIVKSIADGILKNLPTIVESIVKLIAKLLATIVSKLPEILAMGVKLVGEIATGLIQGIPKLLGAVPKLVKSIWDGFTNVNWLSVGGGIINGIANGVTSMASSLWNTVQNVAGGILGSIKSFFGIHSPSTVFRDQVGKMLAIGLGEGFEDYLPIDGMVDALTGAMDDMASVDAPVLNYNGAQAGDGSSSMQQGSGIIINIYGSEYQDEDEIARAVERKLTMWSNQQRMALA